MRVLLRDLQKTLRVAVAGDKGKGVFFIDHAALYGKLEDGQVLFPGLRAEGHRAPLSPSDTGRADSDFFVDETTT